MIGRKIQNYKIVSLLGEGGMGTVYKSIDTVLERYAALKIVHLNALPNSAAVERFKREARNQAKLSHPNIVSVYGFVQEKDVLGIAMEFVEGETIESIIKSRGRVEISYAVELMEQILDGIEAAHNQGFIHRDLKPSNIILDLNGNPKIMDFGISKSVDELKTITQQNARPGTLLYMSPEQLSGNQVTIKSDLYALGITFYEMLTGFHPYNASTIYDIIDAHVNKIPEKISNQIESIPFIVDEIILRAMNKSTSNNFDGAFDFKIALQQLKNNDAYKYSISDEPVEVFELNDDLPKERSKSFNRISNVLLAILFIGLSLIVFNVVKSVIAENEKSEDNQLSYSQEYSINPSSLNSTDWTLIKLETLSNINSISFFDDYNGYLVGDSALIMVTSDGGASWKKNNVDFNNNINSTFLIDDKLFMVGSTGFAGYISKGSKKINKIQLSVSETLFKIFFHGHDIGFIVGSNGTLLKSNDGGLTWKKIILNRSDNIFSLGFADDKIGYAVGWKGNLLKTIDGGVTWQKENIGHSTYLKDILFVNEFLGFIIGGEGLVLRTENGGDDWEELELNTESGLYKIEFVNSDEGMILSNRGEVFFSSDAGKNWNKKYIGAPLTLNDIQKLNSGNFLIAANNGNLIKSKINVK